MATINEMFVTAVSEGMKAAKTITDASNRAMAYAELAKALAMKSNNMTPSINAEDVSTPAEGKESLKETPKAKVETKPEPAPKEEKKAPALGKPKAQPAPEPEPEPQEPELVDEWTEEMIELKAEAIATMNQWKEEYDEESLDQAVQMFSEGQLESLADISPLNIDAFLEFLESLSNQAE